MHTYKCMCRYTVYVSVSSYVYVSVKSSDPYTIFTIYNQYQCRPPWGLAAAEVEADLPAEHAVLGVLSPESEPPNPKYRTLNPNPTYEARKPEL